MYDAQMISISMLNDATLDRLKAKRREARSAIRTLFEDEEYDAAVRQGTNTPSRVRHRIRRTVAELRELARD